MNPSACRVEACQPWRRGDPPCRGSCRASSRTAWEERGSREVRWRDGGSTAVRRRFDGVDGSDRVGSRNFRGDFRARRRTGTVEARRGARAEGGGRTDRSARRRARTARGVFLSLALPAVISWSDGMARAPKVLLPLSSPGHASEAEGGTDAHALAARRPRESSRGVARTHQRRPVPRRDHAVRARVFVVTAQAAVETESASFFLAQGLPLTCRRCFPAFCEYLRTGPCSLTHHGNEPVPSEQDPVEIFLLVF